MKIAKLSALGGAEINEAKKRLATEATALVHGMRQGAAGRGDGAQDLRGGHARRVAADRRDLPALAAGIGVLTAFVQAGLVPSTIGGAAPDQGRRPSSQRCRRER